MFIKSLNFDGDGAPGGAPPATPPPPAPDAPPAATGGGTITFTPEQQEQINKIVGDRAKQAERATQEKLLKDLGVASSDDLKAILKAHKEAEDAKKSDAEKAQAALTEAAKRAADAEAARDKALEERDEVLVKNAVILEAIRLEFSNPDDAYKILMADSAVEIEISEDGATVKGFEKALGELAKSGRLPMKTAAPAQPRGTPPGRGAVKPPPNGQPPAQPERPLIRF